ncbi:hypothetical protein LUZ60_000180 [Juncus effusus]|nr:hypothetical protein LUZ60_000180 [Juncus effusus]
MLKTKKFLEKLINPFTNRHNQGGKKNEEENLEAILEMERRVFNYETLVSATKNFSVKLGEGGFGPVFKGLMADGREVAVKRLAVGSRQGETQFANEASLLSTVQHKNVVHLYGFCTHGDNRLLVYEYVKNESLDKILFSSVDDCPRRTELTWQRRHTIITSIARGLLYLHEGAQTPIIHRDIKSGNILLDDKFIPKIADFGMARLFPEDESHVNTRVAGTNGYMAPEYLMHGCLSPKADVYSFGVVVVEVVSGVRCHGFVPVGESNAKSLLEWAWKLYKEDRILEIVDSEIRSNIDLGQVKTCIQVGLLCTQAEPRLRPDMKRVSIIFSKKPTALEEPSRPGLPGHRYRIRSRITGESNSRVSSSGTAGSSSSFSSNNLTSYASENKLGLRESDVASSSSRGK